MKVDEKRAGHWRQAHERNAIVFPADADGSIVLDLLDDREELLQTIADLRVEFLHVLDKDNNG